VALPPEFDEVLAAGTAALGLTLDGEARRKLSAYVERLLAWNRKVNLTAITEPAAVAELHLVDSLALLRTLGPARSLLDVGCGAGLPGIALACARPALAVTCCDTVFKKVAFVKTIAAELDLAVAGKSVRCAGNPEAEGLPRCEAVVSRALSDPARWLPLGARYLADGGKLFAMLGREADEGVLRGLAAGNELVLEEVDRFTLPRSGAARAIARFRRG